MSEITSFIFSPQRSRMAGLTLLTVAVVTAFAVLGLHPRLGWVTTRQAMLLAGMNLLSAAVYFELLSPNRDVVPKYVTSSLAVFAGIIASLTMHIYFRSVPKDLFEFLGLSAFLLLIVWNWMWYEIFILGSFRERVSEMVDDGPFPDYLEEMLRESEDGEE